MYGSLGESECVPFWCFWCFESAFHGQALVSECLAWGGWDPQAKESEPQLLFFLGSLFSFFNRCPFYSGYLYLLCSVSICGCFLETCPFYLSHFVVDINWLILLPYLVRHHLRREFLVRNRLLGGSVGWTNDTT